MALSLASAAPPTLPADLANSAITLSEDQQQRVNVYKPACGSGPQGSRALLRPLSSGGLTVRHLVVTPLDILVASLSETGRWSKASGAMAEAYSREIASLVELEAAQRRREIQDRKRHARAEALEAALAERRAKVASGEMTAAAAEVAASDESAALAALAAEEDEAEAELQFGTGSKAGTHRLLENGYLWRGTFEAISSVSLKERLLLLSVLYSLVASEVARAIVESEGAKLAFLREALSNQRRCAHCTSSAELSSLFSGVIDIDTSIFNKPGPSPANVAQLASPSSGLGELAFKLRVAQLKDAGLASPCEHGKGEAWRLSASAMEALLSAAKVPSVSHLVALDDNALVNILEMMLKQSASENRASLRCALPLKISKPWKV
jgi:hypothetical protein